MKKQITNTNLEQLAEQLIKQINKRNDIFCPITIVFPNIKVEEWFKLYWLKNYHDILMNVDCKINNGFLFNLIKTEKKYQKINKNKYRNLIIKVLSSNSSLLPSQYHDYIFNQDNSINTIKLFDFSTQMATLYMEYSDDLSVETIDFNDWQKKLYDEVQKECEKYNVISLYEKYLKKASYFEYDYLYFFGFIEFKEIEQKIIDDYCENHNIIFYTLIKDNNCNHDCVVSAVPDKVHEIEILHSKICEILKDNENINYSDFIVMAPDISEYEIAINRVFKQDDVSFPNIPFVIYNNKEMDDNTYIALKTLFKISMNGFYTRFDLFNLINNNVVQEARGITADDIDYWSDLIIRMNIYRNNKTSGWDYAKKRILLSKIVDINQINERIINIDNKEYIPFSSIGLSNESIVRFINIIDDLNSWIKIFNNNQMIDSNNLSLLITELDKWLSIKDDNEQEKNKECQKLVKEIIDWINMEIFDIPINIIKEVLLSQSASNVTGSDKLFTYGITFMNFMSDTVLSFKHVFFIGASSNNLPKIKSFSELDFREKSKKYIDKQYQTFSLQYQNSQYFYVSYINKNLTTSEDYFLSTVINQIKYTENYFSIDETRPWDQLYTKKEYKNKNYYLGLQFVKDDIMENIESFENKIYTYKEKISLKELKDYLEEPLKYKAGQLFKYYDDNFEKMKEEFEPFKLDNLSEYLYTKKMAICLLKNKSLDKETIFEQLKNDFILNNQLPSITDDVLEITFNDLCNASNLIKQNIIKDTNDYKIIKIDDLSLSIDGHNWFLTSDQEFCISVNNDNRTYYVVKKLKDNDDLKDYLLEYVCSLMDVASLNEEKEYKVIISYKNKYEFIVKPSEAKDILNELYLLINDYNYNYCLPIEAIKKTPMKYNEFVTSIKGEYGSWSYFNNKKLFNLYKELGYINEDEIYYSQIKDNIKRIIKCIKLINSEESDDDRNE